MDRSLSVAREVAYDSFIAVMEKGVSPDLVLEKSFKKYQVARRDRNLAKEILFGGLRWYSKIYWIVENLSSRPLTSASAEVRASLILGAYQIFYLDRVPDRAAVNESARYVRSRGQSSAVGFVNAVLRAVARRAEYFTKPDKDRTPVAYLSLQYAHPSWIVERWYQRMSQARLRELLVANNVPPPYDVRMNFLKADSEHVQNLRDGLLRENGAHSIRKPVRSCLSLDRYPDTGEGSSFATGLLTIQGEASQLVGQLVDPQPGEFILDVCCGPGGKLTHLYELSHGQAEILGLDSDKSQIERCRETISRLGHKGLQAKQQNFLNYQPPKPVDKILLDAPCSGLGVLRRHPEGKWLKSPSIIPRSVAKQRELLKHAFAVLRSGGELVYSVCSFEPEEGVQQLAWLRDQFGDKMEVLTPVNRLPDYYKKFVTRENVLIIYCNRKDSMDGFSVFSIRKL